MLKNAEPGQEPNLQLQREIDRKFHESFKSWYHSNPLRYCKSFKPIIETNGKDNLRLMFSSSFKANALCEVECKDEVVPTEPKSDLIIRINTTTWQKTMYGPWSDERLSAFEFNSRNIENVLKCLK